MARQDKTEELAKMNEFIKADAVATKTHFQKVAADAIHNETHQVLPHSGKSLAELKKIKTKKSF